ncbi:hypothetical protein HU200_005962 [Digitaria exilis]|uniref:Uncharacterized protein n=1 Tax=Digitaria exilis TaxID=1010633 RepID=A0A835KSG4_9POAL|nr:hypothetical protein HU200_005962 [Digitaria exilis]
MGHGSGPAAAVDQPCCRVLPVIDEEPEPEGEGQGSPEMTTRLAERRKAIVARMRELLGRAAAAQSAHSKLRRSTLATAKKWKRAVGRIQNKGRNHQQVTGLHEDGSMLSRSSSSISSQSSFTWDAAAMAATESCCSASACACSSPTSLSPLLWPAAFVSTWRAETAADQRQQLASSPAASVQRLSCGSSWSEDDDDARMAHWVTTDSDCKFSDSGNSIFREREIVLIR